MALKKSGIDGLGAVLKNLNREVKGIEQRSITGLVQGGKVIRREGMKITPVATGNLVNSWYGPEPIADNPPTVELGLTANYAVYVHEMINANFKKPGAQAKFLETPLKERADEVLAEIRKEVQIK